MPLKATVEEIRSVATQAAAELARITHRLVGSLAFLGLAGAADLARKIEGVCESGELSALIPLLDELEEEFVIVQRLLPEFLARLLAEPGAVFPEGELAMAG